MRNTMILFCELCDQPCLEVELQQMTAEVLKKLEEAKMHDTSRYLLLWPRCLLVPCPGWPPPSSGHLSEMLLNVLNLCRACQAEPGKPSADSHRDREGHGSDPHKLCQRCRLWAADGIPRLCRVQGLGAGGNPVSVVVLGL